LGGSSIRSYFRVIGSSTVYHLQATMAIDKGMPIEQVQQLLGHEKIDTTLHYAMVKQSNVKNAHRKIMG